MWTTKVPLTLVIPILPLPECPSRENKMIVTCILQTDLISTYKVDFDAKHQVVSNPGVARFQSVSLTIWEHGSLRMFDRMLFWNSASLFYAVKQLFISNRWKKTDN